MQQLSHPLDHTRPWRWRERAVQWLDGSLGRFLDYGCGRCELMAMIQDRCSECHGVDVDNVKIETARLEHPPFRLHVIGLDGRTKYPSNYFDTVALVEVLEHVPNEAATLTEVARVLKPGGTLLLTTPHRGLFTFLDLGNFKFLLPRVHRFIHTKVLRNREYYVRRFESALAVGLVGDISVSSNRLPWHRHYKLAEVQSFCPPVLRMEKHAIYFPCMRALLFLKAVLRVISLGIIRRLPPPLSIIERLLSQVESRSGDQLVIRFVKIDSPAEHRAGAST